MTGPEADVTGAPRLDGVRSAVGRLGLWAAIGLGVALALAACTASGHGAGPGSDPAAAGSVASGSPTPDPTAATGGEPAVSTSAPAPASSSAAATVTALATPGSGSALAAFVTAGRSVPAADFGSGGSTASPVVFVTPSDNIVCGLLPRSSGVAPEMLCEVREYSYPVPAKPTSCSLNYGAGWLQLTSAGLTRGLCLGGPPIPETGPTLAYGDQLRVGELACRSESTFLACVDLSTTHGFVVNRASLHTY